MTPGSASPPAFFFLLNTEVVVGFHAEMNLTYRGRFFVVYGTHDGEWFTGTSLRRRIPPMCYAQPIRSDRLHELLLDAVMGKGTETDEQAYEAYIAACEGPRIPRGPQLGQLGLDFQ